ncbi:unnamed protein product [Acanthoscelides obtectus]|uniref:BHLH domain-containing protein n=1 Tax=Acanthoscelides obtectus TaxID=200917 RepID=A0A9P0LIT1_ACAOB|nr:unnamed protein product [Acanthoscelides obtectus]CAK1640299.1 Transcription factor 21 [Acanthoscelides obtectus]
MPRQNRRQVPSVCSDTILPHSSTSTSDTESEDSSNGGRAPRQPIYQRNAANERERARMRVLSRAFCRLKTTLPWVPADTKLSKLDTLRLATSYIAHLRAVLMDGNPEEIEQKHPLTLTWPFSFQRATMTSSDAAAADPLDDPGICGGGGSIAGGVSLISMEREAQMSSLEHHHLNHKPSSVSYYY